MGEGSTDEGIGLDDLARLDLTSIGTLDDSPLAHSLRRRKREVDCPERTIASHDSLI